MLSVNVFDLTYTFIYKKYGGRAVSRRLFFVLDRGGDQGFETTCFHFFFVMNVPRANSSEERRVDKGTGGPIPREKKGGHEKGRSGNVRFESGMVTRSGSVRSKKKDD